MLGGQEVIDPFHPSPVAKGYYIVERRLCKKGGGVSIIDVVIEKFDPPTEGDWLNDILKLKLGPLKFGIFDFSYTVGTPLTTDTEYVTCSVGGKDGRFLRVKYEL